MKDPGSNFWVSTLVSIAPFALLFGLWFFLLRQMQSGGNKAMSFGKSRARLLSMQQKKVTFKDVAGVDEAKEELKETSLNFSVRPRSSNASAAVFLRAFCSSDLREPARLSSPALSPAKRMYRSFRSPALTSSRCSSASAPAASATSSSRARANAPLHHLHRRDRRCQAVIVAQASAADTMSASGHPQPASGRDGRLRVQRRRHPDRRHQPARRARSCSSPSRSLRPPRHRRPPRHPWPRRGSARSLSKKVPSFGRRRQPQHPGLRHTGLLRRRSSQHGE